MSDDQPPNEPPAEVPPPPVEGPTPPAVVVPIVPPYRDHMNSVEAKIVIRTWRLIMDIDEPSLTKVDVYGRYGYPNELPVESPFHTHIYEMLDHFKEYRKHLELMRNKILMAVEGVNFERRIGMNGAKIHQALIEEINRSFDSLCVECYDPEFHLNCEVWKKRIGKPFSDDEASLFSSVDESADEDEREQMEENIE
jgi:hypothetical protein